MRSADITRSDLSRPSCPRRPCADRWRPASLVFGRGLNLAAVERQNRRAAAFRGIKRQEGPVYRHLPAADAEKPAEIDDGGAQSAIAIDDDIGDQAELFPLRSDDVLAEDVGGLAGV